MTKKLQPKVSIILLNWNGLENTKECLASLKKLDYDNYEVIVVDNGSSEDSKTYLRQLDDIILVDNPKNRGFTGGHIDGYKVSRGEYIFILNNDAIVDPQCINIALKQFEADPTVGAVSGKMYIWLKPEDAYKDNLPFYSFQRISPLTGEAITLSYDFGEVQQPNNVSGAGVIFKRTVLDQIGYFYERLFAYYEETDLFARMKRSGFKVLYDPNMKAWHKVGQSTKDKPYMFYYLMFRNRFICVLRHFEKPFLWRFLRNYTKVAIVSMLRFIRHRNVQDKAQAAAFWWNIFHIIPTLTGRRQLAKTMPSNWNRLLISEQRELASVMIDCTKTIEGLNQTLDSLRNQQLIPADITVLLSKKTASQKNALEAHYGQALRIVNDKQFTPLQADNFAIMLAKSDWVLALESGETLQPTALAEGVYQGIKTGAGVICFGDLPPQPQEALQTFRTLQPVPRCMVRKDVAVAVKGLPNLTTQATARLQFLAHIIAHRYDYVTISNQLLQTHNTASAKLTENQCNKLLHVFKTHRPLGQTTPKLFLPYQRLVNNHRRVMHLHILVAWEFHPKVKLRQKLGRTKNLILAALSLNKAKGKEELTHIRNEYYAATNRITHVRGVLPKNPTDTLVFIICRDRLEPLQELLRWLKKNGLHRIVLVDNQSTYPPLVAFLKTTEYQVIALDQNQGHTSPWLSGTVPLMAGDEYYILSDPDVIPDSNCPPDVLEYLYSVLKRFPHHAKVGFGLRIDNLPDHYALKKPVIEWEEQFWKPEIELAPGIYEAGVDTTFALYRAHTPYVIHPSLRTGAPYVAAHLPWYVNSNTANEEETYYRTHASSDINSWNRDSLPDRYKHELRKQQKGT